MTTTLIYDGTRYQLDGHVDPTAVITEARNSAAMRSHNDTDIPLARFELAGGGAIQVSVERGVPIAFVTEE